VGTSSAEGRYRSLKERRATRLAGKGGGSVAALR